MTCDAMHLGLGCTLHMHSESLITRGRNNIVRKFLAEEQFTHLFWIDSDIAFTPDSVFRLLRADREIVAGVYPMKKMNWPAGGVSEGTTQRQFEDKYTEYPFNPIDHGKARVSQFADGDGFIEVAEAPNGFMCVKRDVFRRLTESYPQLRYTPDGPPGHPQAHLHWRFYDCMIDPDSGRYLSEDYAFCRLARHRRQGVGRSRMQTQPPRPAHVPRRSGGKPAGAREVVRARRETNRRRTRLRHGTCPETCAYFATDRIIAHVSSPNTGGERFAHCADGASR
jgi:hypothetical protein